MRNLFLVLMTAIISLPVFGYVTRSDVTYDVINSVPLYLDVFTPSKKSAAPMPSLMFIHGGCYSMGSRKDIPEEIKKLADDGFTVFSVEYRLAPKDVYPAAVDDVRAAIRFIRKNASAFQIDPERISVHGESAGGYLAAMMGVRLLRDRDGHADEFSAPVKFVSDWFGRTDFTATQTTGTDCAEVFLGKKRTPQTMKDFVEASVTNVVLKRPSKFLIIHGTKDQQVYPSHSTNLANRLWRNGADAELYFYEGAGHGFPRATPWQITRNALLNLERPSSVFTLPFVVRELRSTRGPWGLDLILDNKDRVPVILDGHTLSDFSGSVGVISPTSGGKLNVKTQFPEDQDAIDLH